MSKFVIHKKGFFYTDEAFEADDSVNGSIVATFDNLDAAKSEKERQDIMSMQNLKGMNVIDFFFYSKAYDQIFQQMQAYYKSEYGVTISDRDYSEFPEEMNENQAKFFLNLLDISFHDIIEYADDKVLNPEEFNLDEYELGEF